MNSPINEAHFSRTKMNQKGNIFDFSIRYMTSLHLKKIATLCQCVMALKV